MKILMLLIFLTSCGQYSVKVERLNIDLSYRPSLSETVLKASEIMNEYANAEIVKEKETVSQVEGVGGDIKNEDIGINVIFDIAYREDSYAAWSYCYYSDNDYPVGCYVIFNTNPKVSVLNDRDKMITTAIHEMGHCFGLGHDVERRSIMHESSFFGAFAYKLEDKTEFDGLMINFINSLNQRR